MRFAEQWNWCTVDSIRDVTPTIREFRLRPDNRRVAPCPPGSHITVSLLIDGQPARRSYSLVENGDAGTYRIAVRLAPDSRGGSRGMWSLQAGARIEATNPTSLLDIDWSRKNYCLIAGGIGITPITSIAAALCRRNIDAVMHYAVKSRGDAAFLDELSALLGDRLNLYASDESARLDLDATFRALPDDAIAIICGPMRMLEAARLHGIDTLFMLTEPWLAGHFRRLGVRLEPIGSPIEHRGQRVPSMMSVTVTIRSLHLLVRPLYNGLAEKIRGDYAQVSSFRRAA